VKRLWVDANVLLRFLTRDPEDMAAKAASLMLRAEQGEVALVVSPLTVAELVWVLKSFYRRSLSEIAEVVVPLLSADGIVVEERELMIRALELARDKNVSFADAVLALQAVRREEAVCTFDVADFKKLPAVWTSPG
jgi:predicted nucleic acid-binding protein